MLTVREQGLRARGRIRWWVRDVRTGRFRGGGRINNLIVDAAAPYLADLIREATGSTALRAMAIGSNGTTPLPGDTQLGTEETRKVVPAAGTDTAYEKNLLSGSTAILRQTFGPGLVLTVREVGAFGDIATPPGAANEGHFWNHALVGPATLSTNDQFTVEMQFEFA